MRAAEQHLFGMEGYGWIFEHDRDGVLVADDEVAMVHGDREDVPQSQSVAGRLRSLPVDVKRSMQLSRSTRSFVATAVAALGGPNRLRRYGQRGFGRRWQLCLLESIQINFGT